MSGGQHKLQVPDQQVEGIETVESIGSVESVELVGTRAADPLNKKNDVVLSVEQVSGGYEKKLVVQDVSLELYKGEFLSLLGPNGSGKTTLLKLITGLLPLTSGKVTLHGRPLQSYSAVEKARMISVLSQEGQVSFDFTVEEIVSLGRYPFQQGLFKTFSKQDQQRVAAMMELTQVTAFRNIPFRLLSGGEKQRVLLAKALVQEPQLLILDEPTNHLDIQHSYELIQLLKEWQTTKQLTVLAILHDLNVAALFSDRVALLHQGQIKEVGEPSILKKKEQLREVYQVEVRVRDHPDLPKPQLHLAIAPPEQTTEPLEQMYTLEQDHQLIHLQFHQPLRTLSNGVLGAGLQWAQHFCNFHVDMDYICVDPMTDCAGWLVERRIPVEKAVSMMTAVSLGCMAQATESYYGISFMAIVTAGVGGAVDIVGDTEPQVVRRAGTINTFVFVDAHLTDGALFNASLSATEAKTKALAALGVLDPQTNSIATGTSTDSLCLASTQRGTSTPYAGSGTVLGKGIAKVVYAATMKAIKNYQEKR